MPYCSGQWCDAQHTAKYVLGKADCISLCTLFPYFLKFLVNCGPEFGAGVFGIHCLLEGMSGEWTQQHIDPKLTKKAI